MKPNTPTPPSQYTSSPDFLRRLWSLVQSHTLPAIWVHHSHGHTVFSIWYWEGEHDIPPVAGAGCEPIRIDDPTIISLVDGPLTYTQWRRARYYAQVQDQTMRRRPQGLSTRSIVTATLQRIG